jgi:hypothetical protein
MARIVTHSAQKTHRHDHAPISTGVGLITLEECP